jgi:chorismate mutase/prephenate dehydratase
MTLEELRQRIDRLDEQIVALLSERAAAAREIGRIKCDGGMAVYSPAREREVLERIRKLNPGPLPDSCLTAIWREVMSASFLLEKPLKIAFLGPEGTFSHLAAVGKFGRSVEYMPLRDIAGIFTEVVRGHADHGLVPIENSTAGSVRETLEGFIRSGSAGPTGVGGVRVCAEVLLRVRHNLVGRAASVKHVRRIYSKPEGFIQCRQWLSGLSEPVDTIPVASTAKGAEMAAADPDAAAIGSTLAAEIHGLRVICAGIEDDPNNTTRFYVIGREAARRSGTDKTALMVGVPHRSGALRDVLEVFARHNINLTWIEPHPSGQHNWEYDFFIDVEGHADDPHVRSALAELRGTLPRMTVLGSFPRAGEVV